VHVVNKLCHCPNPDCSGSSATISPEAELSLTMPWWQIGWDIFAWIGQRRFARHWSVNQIQLELQDSYGVPISHDAIGKYVKTYQTMVAARQQERALLSADYHGVKDLLLSIDGLQPEKGHETLYVVRELRRRRVWFAEPLLSSAAGEIQPLLERAKQWAADLGLPVALWLSDKQAAFVHGLAQIFPGTPHRYCENHFLRDLARPVLEADSHAKVTMRRKVRGLRGIEREVLVERREKTESAGTAGERPAATTQATCAGEVVLDYCAAVRGVLNDSQGGPLRPPGLKMADGLREIRQSLQRNLEVKKGVKTKRA
jgi:hypothetical protein